MEIKNGTKMERNLAISNKLCLPFDPSMPLVGIYIEDILAQKGNNLCTAYFISALFLIAKY